MDNPLKPYKAYAALVAAFLTSLISSGVLPPLWASIATAFVAGLGAFFIPNPKKAGERRPGPPENQDALF